MRPPCDDWAKRKRNLQASESFIVDDPIQRRASILFRNLLVISEARHGTAAGATPLPRWRPPIHGANSRPIAWTLTPPHGNRLGGAIASEDI